MRPNAGRAAGFLKSLANEHRLMILCSLIEGEKSVGDLQEELNMRQPHLSQQLSRLRLGGLVETRREAQTIYYSLTDETATEVIGVLHRRFCKAKPRQRTRQAATRATSAARRADPATPDARL
ncbi:metalloregulator ArsR/SmtB family transcription factor [Rhodopila globiformis]|nr:metalloregulator ArsR/SmtB family transcription factor [Rhodopila globiformis]